VGGTIDYGGICWDGFGPEEARVACRHMGLAGGRLLPVKPPPAGEGSRGIVVSHVQCKGNENRLENCTSHTGKYVRCPSGKYAGISCDGKHKPMGQPALSGVQSTHMDVVPCSLGQPSLIELHCIDVPAELMPSIYCG